MARIIYSGLVTEIRGSIGGSTFQRNAYGFSVKNKANMVIPNSQIQEQRKRIISAATKNWNRMSAAGRTNWETFASTFPQYARHNPSSILSGFAVFVKWHTAYYLAGYSLDYITDDPSTSPLPYDPVSIRLIIAMGTMSLATTWAIGDESWIINYFLTRPFSASQYFVGSSPRWICWGSNTNGSIAIDAQYIAVFGALPPVGSYVNVVTQLFDSHGGKVLARSTYRTTVET